MQSLGINRWRGRNFGIVPQKQASNVLQKRHHGAAASPCSLNFGSHQEGLVDVSDLAAKMRREVREYTQSLTSNTRIKMVGILADSGRPREDAEVYSERIGRTFWEDGIDYEIFRCSGDQPSDVESVIKEANNRDDVHGILVFYPIFKGRSDIKDVRGPYLNKLTGVRYKTHDDYLRDIVSPEKDVEGLSQQYNARWLFRARGQNRSDRDIYVPCTALAVMKILEEYHPVSSVPMNQLCTEVKMWSGCTITVVNRSNILGRPLAALLSLEGANVYSVDENSILLFTEEGRMRKVGKFTLEDCLERSSIVISGVPSPDFVLPSDAIAEDSTVVNVSPYPGVCTELLKVRPDLKLVPSVGKVTVAALEQNLVRLHRRAVRVESRPTVTFIGRSPEGDKVCI